MVRGPLEPRPAAGDPRASREKLKNVLLQRRKLLAAVLYYPEKNATSIPSGWLLDRPIT